MLRAWCKYRNMEYVEGHVTPLPSDNFEKGFIAGASSQWVSIKDSLPKEGETVIGAVFDDDGELYQLRCVKFYGRKIDGLHFKTVIEGDRHPISHWMRIPPVKGGEK